MDPLPHRIAASIPSLGSLYHRLVQNRFESYVAEFTAGKTADRIPVVIE